MEVSALTLAFIGDAVYSLKVREYLCSFPDRPLALLTKETIKYVSAKAQAKVMKRLLTDNYLTAEELAIYHRGRNSHSHSTAKHTDPITYHVATGLEAVFGYLYLNHQEERLTQIWDYIKTITEE